MKRLRSRRLWPTRLQNSRYSNHLMGAPYIGAPISFNLRCSPGSSFWRSPTRRHSGAPESPYLPLPLPVLALAVVCSRPCRCQFSPLPLSVLRREQGASQAAEKPLFCLSEGAGGFSPGTFARSAKQPFFRSLFSHLNKPNRIKEIQPRVFFSHPTPQKLQQIHVVKPLEPPNST